ncbi:hypothetical protein MHYP_G00320530 [Metynnis hypsauchen]
MDAIGTETTSSGATVWTVVSHLLTHTTEGVDHTDGSPPPRHRARSPSWTFHDDQHVSSYDTNPATPRRPRQSPSNCHDAHYRQSTRDDCSPSRFCRDSSHPYDYGQTDLVHHCIDTGAEKPIKLRPYRASPATQVLLKTEVDKLLEHGIIEESHSPWSAPVVLVRKKDGTHRFCVDYRRLNSVTVKDSHPLPRVDTLDRLAGAQIFSTIDLTAGYWQIPLHPRDKEKTVFSTGSGLFHFRMMPMGISNAPPSFQHLMELVLCGLHWDICLIYLDDIIVYSTDFSQHLQHLKEVFQRFHAAGLKLKPSKCHLARSCHVLRPSHLQCWYPT